MKGVLFGEVILDSLILNLGKYGNCFLRNFIDELQFCQR